MTNPYKTLAVMVDSIEKLYTMPHNEIIDNKQLVAEIKNAFSVHNVDSIINSARNELIEAKNMQHHSSATQSQLLHAYAAREHDRVKHAEVKNEYVTTIVKAADDLPADGLMNVKVDKAIEDKFATVFNSVYSDGAVKINTPSDPSTLMTYIDYSPYRVNYAEYLSMPTLPEMVDRPLAIALKKFPEVTSKSEKFNKEIIKAIRKKKIKAVIKDALFFSTLSPRGSLVVPILRGDNVTFNVFNDTQFAYGMGSSYSGVTQPYMETRVGDLYCMGAKLRHGVSAFFTCPGYEPLFAVGLNRLPQLRTAAEAWNLYIHILKILLVRSQVIIEKMEGDIQTDTMLAKMRSQLQRLSQTMGVSTPIEQARGMELDILNNNIGPGTADIAIVFKDYIGSVTGVSPEYFFGGGNAAYSQAAFQINSTNENLHSRYQVGMVEPLLRFMVNTLIRYDKDFMGQGVEEDDFSIDFENLYDETMVEKADLTAKKTDILIRQFEYKELEAEFKKEGLLSDDINFPEMEIPHNGEKEIDDDGKEGILTNPMS